MFIGLTAEDGTSQVFNINFITRVRPGPQGGSLVNVMGDEIYVQEAPDQIMVRIAECIRAETLMRYEAIGGSV